MAIGLPLLSAEPRPPRFRRLGPACSERCPRPSPMRSVRAPFRTLSGEDGKSPGRTSPCGGAVYLSGCSPYNPILPHVKRGEPIFLRHANRKISSVRRRRCCALNQRRYKCSAKGVPNGPFHRCCAVLFAVPFNATTAGPAPLTTEQWRRPHHGQERNRDAPSKPLSPYDQGQARRIVRRP